ncbi:MAG: MotA/TolQ/ExbB proton channel family protein [Kiritimatiellae bacterium]|nr:MotA/TolQ/ExbB proton channel family protein [Kiritimatiellia bacterium]
MKMSKIKKTVMAAAIVFGTCAAPVAAFHSFGQELTDAEGNKVDANAAAPQSKKSGGGFYDIVFGSGIVGMILWFALFGDGALAIYFSIDSSVLIKPDKLMPRRLMDGVQAAMAEGDVVKAMEVCQQNPSAMASIVMAAFQHIEEGFEAIQEAVTAASDLEQEKIQQRLNWISVCGNLGPSLGLLGTVQGMILTFQALASGGAGDASALASSIGQALWTTAGGLIVSIPSITVFYSLRNKANRLILKMTAMTMEILNGLRNVSVEAGAEEALPAEEVPA